MSDLSIVASCPRGLEGVLQQEISTITQKPSELGEGLVRLQGNWADIYRLNIYSRVASRILCLLSRQPVSNEQDVYSVAKKIAWPNYMRLDQTFKIRIEGKGAKVNSLNFVSLKIKDAICDVFREKTGQRPSVDKDNADIRISAFINDKEVFIYLDTSGESLFKRGWRKDKGEAPIRENLAAGLLLLAGYDGSQPFLDPMCGSGTIAIEAAWIAMNKAPGLNRGFAFENLANFQPNLLAKIKQEAKDGERTAQQAIYAQDLMAVMLKKALQNARNAHVDDVIRFSKVDFIESKAPDSSGLMICNPPYGIRMGEIEEIREQYPDWSSVLKNQFAGWTVGFISNDLQFNKFLRLSPKRKFPVFNGKLECRLFLFDMVSGSNRKD